METIVVIIFVLGYLAIVSEHVIKVNKTATALLTGIICWTLFALSTPDPTFMDRSHYKEVVSALGNSGGAQDQEYSDFIGAELSHTLSGIASILFFLMGAMTIVELIDAHDGFRFITERISTRNVRILLWIVCWLTFFLSAVLDNLTAAIVMVSLIRKLVSEKEKRLFFAGMIIIAANAGGAWSPIGDVTTTMLWTGNQISASGIMSSLIAPSIICLLVPLLFLTFRMKGNLKENPELTEQDDGVYEKGGKIMLFAGVGALIFVPVFKSITHLPPYMGMLLSLGVLWVLSEMINHEQDESEKRKYSAASALSRIDISSVLFFFGILLAISALESMQTLHHFAEYTSQVIGDNRMMITLLGFASAIVDNVPLVAASVGMFPLNTYPTDNMIWEYLAYCAGTGGSLLAIGSAAGIAVMGMEKMDFIWYFKKMSFLALIGYLAGAVFYLIFSS